MILPSHFEDYTRQLMGPFLYKKLIEGLQQDASASIRLNPFKPLKTTQEQNANTAIASASRVPWCENGLILPTRPNFTFDPLLHAGLYYVQESSSMFISEVLRQLVHEPVVMLDLCAAPGGKTTATRAVLPAGSLLFTNEPMKLRANILSENIQKFGHSDVIVTNNYPKDYRKAGQLFDIILADVPCSGEGMFRKDPNAIDEWSLQNVEKCTALQRSIIEDIWPCLREGGLLVYSTCTFNAHENEENVEWIAQNLGANFVEIEIKEQWNITGSLVNNHPVYRFIPGLTSGEGLFMAVLRKHGDSANVMSEACASATKETARKRHKGKERQATPSADIAKTATWLQGDFTIIEEKGSIRAIPTWWTSVYNRIKSSLYVIHAGITIGNIKGRDVIPDTSLALSTSLNTAAFPSAELSYTYALNYLRKEAITINSNVPTGLVIVTYRNQPLGFVKNIGNRANNLYPQEWKIKTSHLPDSDAYII